MSYQVIHVQKLKGSAIGGVEIHSEREREGVSHTNPDIDWSKTEQNYQLHEPALHARGTYARRIDDRLREAGIARVRKDAVKLCGIVISSDREFFTQLSAEQQREFFQRSYDFMVARYGKENILSAVVHMDETTPHMHLYLVPITQDNRLCCKEIFDKRGLAALHDEFYREVGKVYGLERGEGADKGKRREHFDTQEFKSYTAAIEKQQERLVEARQALSEMQGSVNALRQNKDGLEREITALTAKREKLTSAEVEAVIGERTWFGGLKGVTYKAFEAIKRTAARVDSMTAAVERMGVERDTALAERDAARAEVERIKNQTNQWVDDANRQLKEKIQEVEKDRPSLKARVEINNLRKENSKLRAIIQEVAPERLHEQPRQKQRCKDEDEQSR